MSSKLTERAQMIVTFQYLRISTGMFIGLFVSMEMKKKTLWNKNNQDYHQ